jgi:hypothetical protein
LSIAVKGKSRLHLRIALSWFKNGGKPRPPPRLGEFSVGKESIKRRDKEKKGRKSTG